MLHVEPIRTPPSDPRDALRRALAEAAQALPAQGPIGVFVHHNTLHALEHLPFHEAVAQAARELETHGYLSEAELRAAHARGRIEDRDLTAALDEELSPQPPFGPLTHRELSPQPPFGPLTHRELCLLALRYPLPVLTESELRWQIDERGALARMRSEVGDRARRDFIARSLAQLRDRDRSAIVHPPAASLDEAPEAWALAALWTECLAFDAPSRRTPAMADRVPAERSHRDLLLSVTGVDPAALVNPWLVRFCGAFLDRGVAEWPMPGRERGMLACFREHVASSVLPLPSALARARRTVREQGERDAEETVLALLDELGVEPVDHAAYLTRALLALPGWAGMVRRLETHPEEHRSAAPSLMELVAIRLTLDQAACIEVARRELDYRGPLARLPAFIRDRSDAHEPPAEQEAAFRLFGVCQLAGLTAADLATTSRETRRAIIERLDDFDELTRRRIWQRAYELHYRDEVFQAVVDVRRRRDPNARRSTPRWQVAFCFDDREESLRRHLEEVAPEVETLGAAGSFGIAIDYADLGVSEPAPLCPVGVVPGHTVREVPEPEHETWADAHSARRGAFARVSRWVGRGSRGLLRAALLTPIFGFAAAFPLVTRVLFPRAAEQLRRHTSRVLLSPPPTELTDHRGDASSENERRGFTPEEHAERLAATLYAMGLVRDFAPIVLLLGHRSVSVNNPHQSAYDCGACGGRRGGPNARVFARAANRPEVREALRARGIHIPDGTHFVSGHHNTANDEVVLYDVQRVPASHREELAALRSALDRARTLDAHERSRRFADVALDVSPAAALRHVERRAGDLSQPRPEYGHAGNAVCIVGRRALTRGLFLDRRAFAVSYDPTIDDDGAILERLLAAACPVGAGITLEYYFSAVDNDRYGAGTKLPHNVTALLGVMDGHASDLRTGLTWEMVEIHEPMRLLFVVESTPEVLLRIVARQPHTVGELVLGEWVQLACIRPDDGAILVFDPARRTFEPWTPSSTPIPEVPSSIAHYRGRRGFVPIVRVREDLEPRSEHHDVG